MPAGGELNLGLAWAARHWARYRPDHLAIESETASLSYRQLDALAIDVAMYLLDAGIAAQRPVGVLARDANILFPMTLGTLLARAQVIVLDPALSSADIAQACEATGVDVILVDHADRDVAVPARRIAWETVVEHRRGAAPDPKARLRWSRPVDAVWGAIVGAEPGGSVRVVRRSDLAMLMDMIRCALELDIRRSTICYTGHPISPIGGFMVAATALLVGGTVLAPRAHTVDHYRGSCERHAVQIAHLHTAQVQELVGSATYTGIRPRAATVLITGAAVPVNLEQRVREVLGSQLVTAGSDEQHRTTTATPWDLCEVVHHWSRYQPERIALVSDDTVYTYRQLDAEIQRVANYLDSAGERPRQPIGVVARDPVLCLLYILGIVRLGGHVILLNPDLPPESLELACKDAGCASILVEDSLVDRLSSAFAGCMLVTRERMTHASSEHRLHRDADPHGLWGIVYSSGTTGAPKGIVHSLLSIAMGYIGWSLELPLTRNSVVFVARPLFYMAGLEIASTTLLVGGTLLVSRQYSAAAYRSSAAEWKIDLAFFTPDHVSELVEQARSGPRAYGAERILVMGSTLPLQLKLVIPELLGSRIIESWGNSEGLGTIADDVAFALRPRSIGRPFLGDFITVVGQDGEERPPGEIGRVAGSSDAQLREYFHRDDLNESLLTDRLVLSEDLGYYDAEGYFYISGRVAERFLRRGVPVFPSEIEDKLIDIHGVLCCTVVGVPDDVEGHVPAAAVVLRDEASATETEILRAANELLPELHRLAKLLFVPSLPRNAAGKVVIDAVRGLFL